MQIQYSNGLLYVDNDYYPAAAVEAIQEGDDIIIRDKTTGLEYARDNYQYVEDDSGDTFANVSLALVYINLQLSLLPQTGGGGGAIFVIWGEENGNLSATSNSGWQYSFGNGAVSSSEHGVVLGVDCELICITSSSVSSTTRTQGVGKNGSVVAQGVFSGNGGVSDMTTPIAFNKGDKVNFDTVVGSGGTRNVVGAWFRTV